MTAAFKNKPARRHGLSFLIIAGLFGLFLFQNIRLAEQYHGKFGAAGVIWSDAYCYYEYLPGIFIREQPTRFKSGMRLRPGFSVNKVTYGVALLQAPFFFSNHQVQTWRGYSGTGFENSYGYTIIVATSTYAFLGLWMVFSLLKNWFNLLTAAVSVIGVFYGTNMFHYCYAEPGMSHAYSFFCAAGLLFFTDRFYRNQTFSWSFMAVVLFVTLAVIIRPLNLFMVLIFALYNCYSWADFKNRFVFLFSKIWIVPVFALAGFIIFLPQFYYWYITTGNWVVSPYSLNNEHFEYLSNPKIFEALFSQRGGWFPYSQIMLLSMIALPFMIYKRRYHGWMILLVFVPVLYLCSSWWAVNFMCAHGYRSLIDYYPVLIIPFAWLFYTIMTKTPRWSHISYTLIVAALIYFACCMNLDFSPVEQCEDKSWTFYEYIKMYDRYF
ncbi:MAG: hypothetical protein HYZ14_09430 [Bacteroidetes bacterium]|nr:hypothetical protein [Bacteroidota bacterium]